MLWGGNWIPTPPRASTEAPSVELPEAELAKITGNATIPANTDRFSGNLYNGSSWRIERVYFLVRAKERNGTVRWTREMTAVLSAGPLETAPFSVPVSGSHDIASTEWNIIRAIGYKSEP